MAARKQFVRRFTRRRRNFAWVGDVGFVADIDSTSVAEAAFTSSGDITASSSSRKALIRKIVGTVVFAPTVLPVASQVFAYVGGIRIDDIDGQATLIDPSDTDDLTEEPWLTTFAGEVLVNAVVMSEPIRHEINIKPNRFLTTDKTIIICSTGIPDFTDDGPFTMWWHMRVLLELP